MTTEEYWRLRNEVIQNMREQDLPVLASGRVVNRTNAPVRQVVNLGVNRSPISMTR